MALSIKNTYWGKNKKTKFPKTKGQKSNASTKAPITKNLELPEDPPDAVEAEEDVAEEAAADFEAIRGEAPNNQLITRELL